ncbi:MAG TPA: hypothetical protein VHZ75_05165 [Solirubrobacteraceae bacterium]|nr:hypothetical protein [Solirubrobacteraceae bacterium]
MAIRAVAGALIALALVPLAPPGVAVWRGASVLPAVVLAVAITAGLRALG